MANRRLIRFGRAVSEVPLAARRWTDVADDPNDPAALVTRARTLQSAWRDEIPDRLGFLLERCQGQRVLDIGCVAHDVARMRSPDWLHGRLTSVAASCLGVDVLEDGVSEMTSRGFSAVVHDFSTGTGPLASHGPFDVIVAGELIEHVEDLGMLFRAARELLDPAGSLIITTPNPYAPHRVKAGQLGLCWENADHIVYAFPSGVAELAERHDLVLTEAATTGRKSRRRRTTRDVAKRVRQRIRGTNWTSVGFITQQGELAPTRVPSGDHRLGLRRPGRFVGETFIYVVRPRSASGEDA